MPRCTCLKEDVLRDWKSEVGLESLSHIVNGGDRYYYSACRSSLID